MTWIKLDDKCARHPKVAGLSDRAFRWWVVALCYASEFLTDGHLPVAFLKTVPSKFREELILAQLWLVEGDETWIHDYLHHQTGRADIERERVRSRQRRAGSTNGRPPVDQRTTDGRPAKDRDQKQKQKQSTESEAETETKNVSGRGALIVSAAAFDALRRYNAYVGTRLRVPHKLHGDFVAALGGKAPDADLRAFYAELDAEIEASGEPIVPDIWKWLEARFRPWAKQRADDAEMAKFLSGEVS